MATTVYYKSEIVYFHYTLRCSRAKWIEAISNVDVLNRPSTTVSNGGQLLITAVMSSHVRLNSRKRKPNHKRDDLSNKISYIEQSTTFHLCHHCPVQMNIDPATVTAICKASGMYTCIVIVVLSIVSRIHTVLSPNHAHSYCLAYTHRFPYNDFAPWTSLRIRTQHDSIGMVS